MYTSCQLVDDYWKPHNLIIIKCVLIAITTKYIRTKQQKLIQH